MAPDRREPAQRPTDSFSVDATVVGTAPASGRFADLFEKPIAAKHPQVGKPGRLTSPLLELVENPSAGEFASVGLCAFSDLEGSSQNKNPFRALLCQGCDRSKCLLLVHLWLALL
jgi:hypothetical protein